MGFLTYNLWTKSEKHLTICQKDLGKGLFSKNDLNKTSDLLGCEKGASWEAPLMVANVRVFAYTWVHPPT